jgi:Tfp pilus assembly protein PilN
MTTGYDRTLAEHARLTILKVLARQAGYHANDSVLADALAAYGFRLSRDRVRTEIDWLAEQGLLTVAQAEHLVVATATRRGVDVAEGLATTAGVKRPGPH